MADDGEDRSPDDRIRHAFGLLASVVLEKWPSWTHRFDHAQLWSRVAVLAELLDVVPYVGMRHLGKVVAGWHLAFPDVGIVTLSQLRAAARAALKTDTEERFAPSAQGTGLLRALALVAPQVPASLSAQQSTNDADDAEACRQCAFGLGVWFDQLDSERWAKLPSCVPGENAVEIEKVYVELYAIPGSNTEFDLARSDVPGRLARQQLSSQYPVVDIPTMLARTLHRCVVIGEPGSGKSTLVRWLAWAVHRGKCPDFASALVVKLGAFAQELTDNPDCSVVEFFFQSLGTRIDDWRAAASALRRIAGENHRFLLLLDGWDEVPPGQRDDVRERVIAEQAHFVTVITSRASGLPRQFCDGDRVDVYHVAGLAPPARDELAGKLLKVHGHHELIEPILHRIDTEPDLREMAANPFLLGLLVRVLSRTDGVRTTPRTLADVYHQLADWVREQHDQFQAEPAKLTAEHLTALRRLSHGLLFGSDRPRYLFRRQELRELMPAASDEPVYRSRFVNRTDPVFDEYAFLHATLQEYFAASHAELLAAVELDAFLDRAFRSSSRLIVLEFLAGLHGAAGLRCRQRAELWLKERDRFQQALLRVARLAAAGRWSEEDVPGLVPKVQRELWDEIRANRDMQLTKLAVEALAELDPAHLARQARANPADLDSWAIQCIADAVPLSIRREERLDELMPGEWRDYAGFDARGGATASDIDAIRSVLTNPASSEETLRRAIIHAGAAKDSGAVPALLTLLRADSPYPDILENVIDSLGMIAGRAAVDALVDVVLGKPQLTGHDVSLAAGVLRHRGHNKQALDPAGRDRLVRHVAALPPDAPMLEPILQALEGWPIRAGAEVIEQIAHRRESPVSIRMAAVLALTGAMDRTRLQRFMGLIAAEPSGEVVDALLLLSATRWVLAPREWLEAVILKTRDKVKLRKLFPAYLLMFVNASGPERTAASGYLNQQLAAALAEAGPDNAARASAWEQALMSNRLPPDSLTADTLQLALDELARFTARPDPDRAPQVRLAAVVVGHFQNAAARMALREALSAGLRFEETKTAGSSVVSQAIANRLAELAPAELLRYSPECECVNAVLQSRAVERGWLVFRNRILDAEGREIATISTADPMTQVSDAPDLRELAEHLPDRSRRVLLAYWWMVRDSGPCQPGDTFRHIYDTTGTLWGNEDDADASYLRTLFPEAIPAFETWKKSLHRIQKQFAEQPALLAQLHRIGLHRRRSR